MGQYHAEPFLRASRHRYSPRSGAPENRTGAEVIESLLYQLTTMVDDLEREIRARSWDRDQAQREASKREIKDAWNQIKGAACLAGAVSGGHLPPKLGDRLTLMVKQVIGATGTEAEISAHSGLE